MSTHLPREKFFCDQCNFVTISTENMKIHKRYDHSTQGKRKFECHCGKVFGRPGDLSNHVKVFHENRKYIVKKNHICTICKKAFGSPSKLKVYNNILKCEKLINSIVSIRYIWHIILENEK